MKKLLSLLVLVVACSFCSCSGDTIPQAGGNTVVNTDIGGQSGQIPPPPPPRQTVKDLSGQVSKS